MKKLGTVFTSLLLAGLVAFSATPAQAVAGTNRWVDTGVTAYWSDDANWEKPVESGDELVFDNTDVNFDAATINDIPNLTVGGIVFMGESDYQYGFMGNAFTLNGMLSSNGRGVFVVDTDVMTQGSQAVQSADDTLLVLAKSVQTTGNLALRSYDTSQIYIDGKVSGSGTAYVYGSGYGVYVSENGSLYRPIVVRDGGLLVGNGVNGSVTVTSTGYIEAQKCMQTNNLTIGGYLYFTIGDLKNCAGNKYSRINAKGKVDLTGGTLASKYALKPGFVPAKGSQVILISNDGTDKVVGTFKNRPHGSKFKIGAYTYKIMYNGGSGNDVVLTRM